MFFVPRFDSRIQPTKPDGPSDNEHGLSQGGAYSHARGTYCSNSKVCIYIFRSLFWSLCLCNSQFFFETLIIYLMNSFKYFTVL